MKVKNRKRELTAKEYAEQYEISVRTVKRYFSQDREDYEQEAKQRRLKAFV
ncbi:plasmid replication protein, partial [Citrobacter freundii]